ncbi:MAG TPA: MarR family transcriptional regulator [Dehalococcoidia bacterium]|nr:MarR family transcriptional regulator [Dehalococcoidia bacterium]
MPHTQLTLREYRALADVRYHLRRFLHASEEFAREAGIESQQYLLLLAIKGMPEGQPATVGEIAERLLVKQHSAAELIDRTEARGFVRRERGEHDRRQVFVRLTRTGDDLLRRLAARHRAELRAIGPELAAALTGALATRDEVRIER